ncbi:nucleotidyltransferase substrate binding protein [Clostridium fessum]|uniref:nucleotidyltransferase substrate binding protein n=1 Tax=Clostridium fessum TaxID=2126740 RepID=UPI003999E112
MAQGQKGQIWKEVLKQAFKAELITDQRWMHILRVRNELAHDYDGVIIKQYCRTIIDEYIDIFFEFKRVVNGIEDLQ